MPDVEDREDILRAVSEKLDLTPEVSAQLRVVAQRTEGFSGADLQALMYNAHLESIHDLLGDTSEAKKSLTNGTKERMPYSSKSKKHEKHDFFQFLYGAEEDAQAKKSITSSAFDSRAAIAAKLDELKLARKREKQMLRGRFGSDTSKDKGGDLPVTNEREVVIGWKHIERSLSTTKSSISSDERRRLGAIYNEFVVGRNGEMPNGDGGREIGGRSSLM